MTAVGWQATIAADCSIIADVIQALAVINDRNYVPTRWAGTLIIMGLVTGVSAFDVFAAGHLRIAEGVFATCRFFAFVPIVAMLWVMVSPTKSASEVFGQFKDYTGTWPNVGVSVLAGQVVGIFASARSDALAHLSDEVEDAAVVVPRSMVWTYTLSGPFTLIVLLTYCFSISSIEEALQSDHALVYVLCNAFPAAGPTIGFTLMILVLLVMVTISALASASRQIFAFASDNGLPFSACFRRVSPGYRVPSNSVTLSIAFTTLLALINFGSDIAFNIILSLATASLIASYGLSAGCIALRRIRKQSLPRARWSLGRAGLPVNCVAAVYSAWCFFWCFWPVRSGGGTGEFNWAIVLFAGIMGAACALYRYGPKAEAYRAPRAKG